jgi:predicted Zn finger-like uncharacterized protein
MVKRIIYEEALRLILIHLGMTILDEYASAIHGKHGWVFTGTRYEYYQKTLAWVGLAKKETFTYHSPPVALNLHSMDSGVFYSKQKHTDVPQLDTPSAYWVVNNSAPDVVMQQEYPLLVSQKLYLNGFRYITEPPDFLDGPTELKEFPIHGASLRAQYGSGWAPDGGGDSFAIITDLEFRYPDEFDANLNKKAHVKFLNVIQNEGSRETLVQFAKERPAPFCRGTFNGEIPDLEHFAKERLKFDFDQQHGDKITDAGKTVVVCPECRTQFRVPRGKTGKVRCTTCDKLFAASS